RVMRVPDGVIYPSRLVAATAESAREHGARILPNTPVVDLHRENDRLVGATVERDGRETIRADHVVNAAGAWAEKLAARAGVRLAMSPTSGVMVAVDFDGIEPVLNRCRPPSAGDLVVPHDSQVGLGTTSGEVSDPDDSDTDREEVDRILGECAAMVPALEGAAISRTYWGVRPLYAPDEAERPGTRSISRGFFLLDHTADGVDGFTSIVGGKLTTHRRMAEAVADHVCEKLGVTGECRTADEPLPSADDPNALDELIEEFEAESPADSDMAGL